jgi:hypothetical protein
LTLSSEWTCAPCCRASRAGSLRSSKLGPQLYSSLHHKPTDRCHSAPPAWNTPPCSCFSCCITVLLRVCTSRYLHSCYQLWGRCTMPVPLLCIEISVLPGPRGAGRAKGRAADWCSTGYHWLCPAARAGNLAARQRAKEVRAVFVTVSSLGRLPPQSALQGQTHYCAQRHKLPQKQGQRQPH